MLARVYHRGPGEPGSQLLVCCCELRGSFSGGLPQVNDLQRPLRHLNQWGCHPKRHSAGWEEIGVQKSW